MARRGLGQAVLDVVEGVLRVLLVLDRQAVLVVVASQGLQEVHRPEVAAAEDREVLGVLDVLEMDAVDPLAEDLDGMDRVLARPQEVAGVDAAADLGVMVLDRLLDGLDLREAVARTVVVDADRPRRTPRPAYRGGRRSRAPDWPRGISGPSPWRTRSTCGWRPRPCRGAPRRSPSASRRPPRAGASARPIFSRVRGHRHVRGVRLPVMHPQVLGRGQGPLEVGLAVRWCRPRRE